MADQATLEAQRQKLLAQIKAKGGKDKAPELAKKMQALDVQIKGMRKEAGATSPAPAGPAIQEVPLPTSPTPNITPTNTNSIIAGQNAQNQWQLGVQQGINNPNYSTPLGGQQYDPTTNTFTQTYDPNQMGLINATTQAGTTAANLGQAALGGYNPNSINWGNQPKILQTGDVSGDRAKVEDALFANITRDYGQQQQQEIEATRQRLANQGIPENPDPNSKWGRIMGAIDKKYQGMNESARNQAISLGNETLSTNIAGQNTALQGFLQSALTQHNVPLQDAQNLYGMITSPFLPNLPGYTAAQLQPTDVVGAAGIGADYQAKMKAIQASQAGRGGGGGRSGGGSSGPIIGGAAPGL